MPDKPKRICPRLCRQVARVTDYDLRRADPLELVGLAVVCHNLAAMTLEELNRRLPERNRADLNLPSPRLGALRGGKETPGESLH
jgi:hypothetical protein